VLLLFSLSTAYLLGTNFFIAVLCLVLTSLLYSIGIREIAYLDVLTISLGHVLRAAAGCFLIFVPISPWLLLCTYLLSLLLALGKRKVELVLLKENAAKYRSVFKIYTPDLLNQFILAIAASLLVSYSIYCFSSVVGSGLMLTIPIVIYLLLKYLQLLHRENSSAAMPEDIFTDKSISIGILLWILSVVVLIYVPTLFLHG